MVGIKRRTWVYFRAISRPFFITSEYRWKAYALLLLLIALSISVNAVNVLMSYVLRDFMTALSERRTLEFFRLLAFYVGCFFLAIPIAVFSRFSEERLVLLWRRSLAQDLLEGYFSRRAYYRIKSDPDIDNPDQRITDDVRAFTGTSVSFLLILFNSVITLIAFLGVLISISTSLGIMVVLYAAFGSLLTIVLGKRLIGLNFNQIKREADLRYTLVHLRDNAESIAFYNGEQHDLTSVKGKLNDAISNFSRIISWTRNLGFFTTGYNYFQSVIALLVVAPLYLQGQVDFGVVTQAPVAFGNVLAALSVIISQYERLSGFIAVVSRLGSFREAISSDLQVSPEEQPETEVFPGVQVAEGERLAFEKVTLTPPGAHRVLVKDLSLQLRSDENMVIVGPSGAGKTAILRTIAGIWNTGAGKIIRPPLDRLMFLPQRPYMVVGSLRQQLIYPNKEAAVPDEVFADVLKKVGLERLLKQLRGFDVEVDWLNTLSLGEQQKISFARLLLSKASMAFLDESTSALDVDSEEMLYGLIKQKLKSFVSVGHRSALFHHHHRMLELMGDGRFKVKSMSAESTSVWI